MLSEVDYAYNASLDLRMETRHDYRHHCGVQLDLCSSVRGTVCAVVLFFFHPII